MFVLRIQASITVDWLWRFHKS